MCTSGSPGLVARVARGPGSVAAVLPGPGSVAAVVPAAAFLRSFLPFVLRCFRARSASRLRWRLFSSPGIRR